MCAMPYKVDLDFVGLGNAGNAYGGYLRAWSFVEKDGREWYEGFRQTSLQAIRNRFLPVYRLADGEYRFLFGRRLNWSRRPLHRELIGYALEATRIKNPDRWQTSWGERYHPEETRFLREHLKACIRKISKTGFLACYINDNAINAFTEYNSSIEDLFQNIGTSLNEENYIPFHFAPSLIVSDGWEDFIVDRDLLIVTGLSASKEKKILTSLGRLGARSVHFLPISATSSLTENIDLSSVQKAIDVAFVAAGIGSANILTQLAPLETLCVDIGGVMNSLVDNDAKQHGGVFGLPTIL